MNTKAQRQQAEKFFKDHKRLQGFFASKVTPSWENSMGLTLIFLGLMFLCADILQFFFPNASSLIVSIPLAVFLWLSLNWREKILKKQEELEHLYFLRITDKPLVGPTFIVAYTVRNLQQPKQSLFFQPHEISEEWKAFRWTEYRLNGQKIENWNWQSLSLTFDVHIQERGPIEIGCEFHFEPTNNTDALRLARAIFAEGHEAFKTKLMRILAEQIANIRGKNPTFASEGKAFKFLRRTFEIAFDKTNMRTELDNVSLLDVHLSHSHFVFRTGSAFLFGSRFSLGEEPNHPE